MANDIPPILIEFQGDIKGIKDSLIKVQESLSKFDKSTEKSTEHVKKMGAGTVAVGALMAGAIQKAATAAYNFSKQTVTAFTDTGKETKQLMRVLGGTPEEMSRLVYASDRLGVQTSTLTSFMTRLGVHMSENDKAAARMGVAYRDATGKLLPSTVVLGNLADKFASLPDGMDKTNLAVKAFGRGGVAMLPILNKGSEGLKNLYKEADNLGLTLSGKNLKDIAEYSNAQKNMHDGIKSLQFTIGRELVPKLATLFNVLSNLVTMVSHFVSNNKTLVTIVVSAVAAFVALYGAIKAYNKIMQVGTTVISTMQKAYKGLAAGEALASWEMLLIIAAVVALVAGFIYALKHFKTFANIIQTGFEMLGTFIGYVIKGILKWVELLVQFWGTVITQFIKGLSLLKPVLNALGIHWADGLSKMADTVDKGKNTIMDKLDKWANAAPAAGKKIGDKLFSGLMTAANFDVMGYIKKLTKGMHTESGIGDGGGDPTLGADAGKKDKKKAVDKVAEYIRAINAAIQQEDSKFKLAMAKSDKLGFDERLKVVQGFMNQNKKIIQAAQDEEKKTRGTKNHAAAVQALSRAIAEQAKMQNQANKITRDAAKALEGQASAQNLLMQSQQNNTSWLAAHNIAAGQANAGTVTVPVVIDGHEVFRVVQKYSNQNNRRNVTTGIGLSGAVI